MRNRLLFLPLAIALAVNDSAAAMVVDPEQHSSTLFGQVHDLTSLFPTALEISDGSPAQGVWYHFEVIEEGTQSANDVAAWLGSADAAEQLALWGWERNAYQVYRMEAQGGPTDVTISIHQFAGDGPLIVFPNGSRLSGELVALDAFTERWTALHGGEAKRAGIMGPGVSLRAGSWRITGEHEVTLFVTSFNMVIRVSAISPVGPQPAGVDRVMDEVLERIESHRAASYRTGDVLGLASKSGCNLP